MKKTIGKAKTAAKIPPPPGLEAGYDAIIAYHKKYSMEELEEAGYLEEVPDEEWRGVQMSATFQLLCSRGLQLKLSRRDCLGLTTLAASQGLDVEDLVRRWIKQGLRQEAKASRNGKA